MTPMVTNRDDSGLPELHEVATKVADGSVSPVTLVEEALQAAAELNPKLNAYITILDEQAHREAETAEQEIRAGDYRGPLHGIPLSVKDLYWTAGVRTSSGSRILSDFVPTEDSAVVERLRQAGAIIVAKANMLEFAYASVHPDYGPSRNPWDLSKSTNGSSGGSAASVAAGLDFGSFGSDTGGSIRLPAAFCGVVGLKPSHGLVSRYGVQPLSWTLDHAGPFARSVKDLALLLDAVSGYDPRDRQSADRPVPSFERDLTESLDGVSIGLLTNFMDDSVDAEVRDAVRAAVTVLAGAGADVREIAVPELEGNTVDAVMSILLPEASFFHQEWIPARKADYTQTVFDRLSAGMETSAVDYFNALETRERLRGRMREIQESVDLFLLPTSATPATPLEPKRTPAEIKIEDDDRRLTNLMRLTAPFDLTGQPALSLCCGFTEGGLPLGLQIVGREFDDSLVLRAGHAYQLRTDWHKRRPPHSAAIGR
jgi:aspartyl-tRNA(Asn)/glutamyl-tRNA(Gln) amidotransferase subunit A